MFTTELIWKALSKEGLDPVLHAGRNFQAEQRRVLAVVHAPYLVLPAVDGRLTVQILPSTLRTQLVSMRSGERTRENNRQR